jgi:outer membrane protein
MALAAQSQVPVTKLSLADAIRMSIAHSDDVRIAASQVKAARARTGIEASKSKPQLEAAGNATRFDNKTNVALGGQTIELLPTHQEALGLQLSQILDVTGQIAAAVSQAKLNALASGYNLRSRTSDQALLATTAYYAILRSREAVGVAQAALDAYQEQLKTTSQLVKQGVGLKVDLLRAQSQVADAERELVQRQNELNSSISALDDQLGLPLDQPLDLSPETPDETTQGPSSSDRPALIAQAVNQRSEILEASLNVAAMKKGIKLARADAEPMVSLGLSGNYYPTTSFQYVRHATAEIDINVQFAILDGGLARNRVNEAQANVDTAVAEQQQVTRAISLQVQNAALDVETARKRWASAKTAVEAADAARKLAEQRYANQVAQYLEVTDAQSALTAAEGAQVDAYYDLLTAQARLTRALGDWTPDSAPITIQPNLTASQERKS